MAIFHTTRTHDCMIYESVMQWTFWKNLAFDQFDAGIDWKTLLMSTISCTKRHGEAWKSSQSCFFRRRWRWRWRWTPRTGRVGHYWNRRSSCSKTTQRPLCADAARRNHCCCACWPRPYWSWSTIWWPTWGRTLRRSPGWHCLTSTTEEIGQKRFPQD